MSVLSFIVPSIIRNPRRSGAYLIGSIIAAGLVSSVLFFVAASAHDMTQRAIAPVRVDLQAVALDSHGSIAGLQRTLAQQPEVAKAHRFALTGFTGAQVRAGNRTGQTATGKLMAVDPGYLAAFGAPQMRQGHLGSS